MLWKRPLNLTLQNRATGTLNANINNFAMRSLVYFTQNITGRGKDQKPLQSLMFNLEIHLF